MKCRLRTKAVKDSFYSICVIFLSFFLLFKANLTSILEYVSHIYRCLTFTDLWQNTAGLFSFLIYAIRKLLHHFCVMFSCELVKLMNKKHCVSSAFIQNWAPIHTVKPHRWAYLILQQGKGCARVIISALLSRACVKRREGKCRHPKLV